VRKAFLLLAGSLLAACGSGGSPGPLEIEFDFQIVSSSGPTTRRVLFGNPVPGAATVEFVEVEGPFAPESGLAPLAAVDGNQIRIEVVFTPPGSGRYDALWRLEVRGEGETREVRLRLGATAEEPGLAAEATSVDFGEVGIGESKTLPIRLRNGAGLSFETLEGAEGFAEGFSLVAPALPAQVAPGETLDLMVRYEPPSLQAASFPLALRTGSGKVLSVTVLGRTTGWAAETIVDFGSVALLANETPTLPVDLPPDAISLTIEAWGGTGDRIGLRELTGPGGKVYENALATGAFLWSEGSEVFVATLPNGDRQEVALVPGGGTYRFKLFRMGGTSAAYRVRAIVHNRPGGVSGPGELDLNVFLAPGLAPDAASAPFDGTMRATLAEAERHLGKRGISFGAISFFDLADGGYDRVTTQGEIDALFAESRGAPDRRLNLFFVKSLFSGTVGIASRIPGPSFGGTSMSGVVVDYEFSNSTTVGYVAAHELGHYLGLYHTVESDGTHDFIDDTLECPASGAGGPCSADGGGYLMHWRVLAVDPVVTAGQGRVLQSHALLRPPGSLAPAPLLAAVPSPPPLDAGALGEGWCGCRGCGAKAR